MINSFWEKNSSVIQEVIVVSGQPLVLCNMDVCAFRRKLEHLKSNLRKLSCMMHLMGFSLKHRPLLQTCVRARVWILCVCLCVCVCVSVCVSVCPSRLPFSFKCKGVFGVSPPPPFAPSSIHVFPHILLLFPLPLRARARRTPVDIPSTCVCLCTTQGVGSPRAVAAVASVFCGVNTMYVCIYRKTDAPTALPFPF